MDEREPINIYYQHGMDDLRQKQQQQQQIIANQKTTLEVHNNVNYDK